uniref:Ami n=1 Tax=Pseudomonas aeruginosa TaxID=287 RepID=F8V255_PSEAI|nr:Ami [Pseudomonas aeruginosa]
MANQALVEQWNALTLLAAKVLGAVERADRCESCSHGAGLISGSGWLSREGGSYAGSAERRGRRICRRRTGCCSRGGWPTRRPGGCSFRQTLRYRRVGRR